MAGRGGDASAVRLPFRLPDADGDDVHIGRSRQALLDPPADCHCSSVYGDGVLLLTGNGAEPLFERGRSSLVGSVVLKSCIRRVHLEITRFEQGDMVGSPVSYKTSERRR